jgi:pimeloyl-ACP methyl ester carboxylesterase
MNRRSLAVSALTVKVGLLSLVAIVTALTFIANRLRRSAFGRQPPVLGSLFAPFNTPDRIIAETRKTGAAWIETTKHDDWRVIAGDSTILHGYWMRNSRSKDRCALVVHGHRASAANVGLIGKMYYDAGFSVLITDGRAHGKSDGATSGLGWIEQCDVAAWLERVVQTCGKNVTVVGHGISMGANAILNLAGTELSPPQLRAIVADSPFTSVGDILAYRLRAQHIPVLPVLHAARVLSIALPPKKMSYSADTRTRVAHISVPVLYIHSANDAQNPSAMSAELAALTASHSELWITEAPAHASSAFTLPNEYGERIFAFLRAVDVISS